MSDPIAAFVLIRWPWLIIVALAMLAPRIVHAADEAAYLEGRALLDVLRGGGYTIYFRHTATDWAQQDHVDKAGDWLSCDPARIRQLAADGRAAARAIGEAMRALRIPVARVLASPYCRTMETARLFDLGDVQASDAVVNMRVADFFGGRDVVIASARALLATPVAAGTNTIVVAHGNVARHATPVYPDEGEGVVFAADRQGGFHAVGRIPVYGWAALLDSMTGAR